MLNKKYAGDLRPSMSPPTKKKSPGVEGSPEEEASEPADEAHDEGDLFGDMGDESGDDEGDMGVDLAGASDDDILAEARKRGLSLSAPSKKKPSSYRGGADDTEADDDSIG